MRPCPGECMHSPAVGACANGTMRRMRRIAGPHMCGPEQKLRVQRRLLLRRRECPGRARAALLAEHQSQLLWRAQFGLARAEGRAGLVEVERAEEVRVEEAILASHLSRGALRRSSALRARHSLPFASWLFSTGRAGWTGRAIKAPRASPLKGSRRILPANRRQNNFYPPGPRISHHPVTAGWFFAHFPEIRAGPVISCTWVTQPGPSFMHFRRPQPSRSSHAPPETPAGRVIICR